jgi:hypothetical protein
VVAVTAKTIDTSMLNGCSSGAALQKPWEYFLNRNPLRHGPVLVAAIR